MDSAWVSSIYLKEDWIERILEDYNDEVEMSRTWAAKAVGGNVRACVWNICETLGVPSVGSLPGHACHILERYLAITIKRKLPSINTYFEWTQFKQDLWSKMPLAIVSCIQIVTKMVSATVSVHPKVIRASLMQKGLEYSIGEIVASEFKVFCIIGFQVPLWTSEEVAQLLSVEVGLPSSYLDRLALIVNAAEYYRYYINERVYSVFSKLTPSTFNTAQLHSLHLAAGAVAASARYHNLDIPDPAQRLSNVTRAPKDYIVLVCNIILSFILNPPDTEFSSESRSDSTDDSDSDVASISVSDSDDDYVASKRFKFSG